MYTRYITNSSLLIGELRENQSSISMLEQILFEDKTFTAKVEQLYANTLINRPMPKEIVNILTHEDKLSILELKKKAIRFLFFIDDNGINIMNHLANRAIVFLSFFKKKTAKTPKLELSKAIQQRVLYMTSKANNKLRVEAI